MSRRLHYSPEALAQLDQLETHLVERAGSKVADAYLDRLLDFCDRLADDPIIGHHRDDLLPGLLIDSQRADQLLRHYLNQTGVDPSRRRARPDAHRLHLPQPLGWPATTQHRTSARGVGELRCDPSVAYDEILSVWDGIERP